MNSEEPRKWEAAWDDEDFLSDFAESDDEDVLHYDGGENRRVEEKTNNVPLMLRNSTVEELRIEVETLKKSASAGRERSKKLLKDNFGRYMKCKSTIDQVYEELQSSLSLDYFEKIEIALKSLMEMHRTIFDPLIENQQRISERRSGLEIIREYGWLLKTPKKVRACVESGDFDGAVREYRKVRKNYDIISARQELAYAAADVEATIDELRKRLLRTLRNHRISRESHLRTIQYLIDLETKEDPVRRLLTIQDQIVRGQIESVDVETASLLSTASSGLLKEEASAIDLSRVLKKLTLVFVRGVPELWYVYQSILRDEKARLTAAVPVEEIGSLIAKTSESFAAVASRIFERMVLRESLLERGPRQLRRGPSVSSVDLRFDSTSIWAEKVAELVGVEDVLLETGIPAEYFSEVPELALKVARRYLEGKSRIYLLRISHLLNEEDWEVKISSHTKHITSRTLLTFMNIVAEATGEFSSVFGRFAMSFQDDIKRWFLEAILIFLDVIHELAFPKDAPAEQLDGSPAMENYSPPLNGGSVAGSTQRSAGTIDQLIIVLCYCFTLRTTVIPRVVDVYLEEEHTDKKVSTHVESTVHPALRYLKRLVLAKIVSVALEEVSLIISDGIILGGDIQWNKAPPPRVLPFVFRIFHHLALLHAQLLRYNTPARYVKKCFAKIVDGIAVQLTRAFDVIHEIDENGAATALASADMLQEVLRSSISGKAEHIFDLFRQRFEPLCGGKEFNISALVKKRIHESRFQLACFIDSS